MPLKRISGPALLTGIAATLFVCTIWTTQALSNAELSASELPQAASPPPQGRGAAGGQGRGRQAGPVEPTPRLADGTVNFGRVPGEKGTWNVPYIQNMARQIIGPDGQVLQAIRDAGRGGGGRGGSKSEPWMPWMPWSAALYDYNSSNDSKYDPEGYCLPPGGPRMMATPYQMEIIQLPEHKRILMIFEGATHIWREIYMDGRQFPDAEALNPTYLGYSIGHWRDKDTLIVETRGFNENSWLDYYGHPHTDLMKVTEKWTRPNKGTLHYEATVDDPGAYTAPFTLAWDIPWSAEGELPEYICQENNQYLNRLTDDFGQPIFGPRAQPGQAPAGRGRGR
jgi:hypothetical protein